MKKSTNFNQGRNPNEQKIAELEAQVAELKDFAIWMTGCGYDFCQHEYFIKQRDVLLKA